MALKKMKDIVEKPAASTTQCALVMDGVDKLCCESEEDEIHLFKPRATTYSCSSHVDFKTTSFHRDTEQLGISRGFSLYPLKIY